MTSQAVTCVFSVLLATNLIFVVSAYPHGDIWPPDNPGVTTETVTGKYVDACRTQGDVETLCQTCAKESRSNIVYPMCCEGTEDTRLWCVSYLGYGKNY